MSIASRIESITEHLTNDWDIVDSLGLYTKKLPKEYTQVDYIQSSGTQYIDTGVNADNKLDTILDMAFTSPTSSNQNVGAISIDGSTTVRYHILCDGSQNNNFRMYTKTNYVGVGTLDANRHTFVFDCSNGKVYFDGTAYNKDTTDFDVGLNFWLFGRNSTSTKFYSNVKQYGCKMYYNNVLVRNFIPCFRNSDNEVGLYDLVNNVFYTNQGTGTFVYGQVQEQHIDKNIENIKEPLNLFYNEVSNKTDLSQNGVVGRTSQETTSISGGDEYDSPSPDYPQPINNLTGNVAYKVVGSQLYDYTDLKSSYSFLTYDDDGWYTVTYDTSGENGKYLNFTTPVSNLLNTDTDYLIVTEVKSLEYTGTGALNPVDRWGQFATATSYLFGNISNNTTYTVIKTTKSDFLNLSGCLTSNVYVGANSSVTIKFRLSIIKDTSVTPSNFNYEPYIEPQTFNIPLKSKNLFDDRLYNGITKNSNGTYKTTKYYTDATEVTYKGNANTQYTISFRNENLELDAGGYSISINGTWVSLANKMHTFTTDSNGETKIKLGASSYADIGNFNKYIQIEQGSTATDYEPYYDIELCKIDTYEDKIYSSDGRFYLEKKTGKSILNGSESWNTASTSTDYGYFYTSLIDNIAVNSYASKKSYCNRFQWVNDMTVSSVNGNNYAITNASSYKLRISIAKSLLSSVDVNGFKSWLSNNNTEIAFPLITPTTTEITQENYPSLYNALKQIQDYLTAYKINKEFILGYSSPEIEY